MRVDTAPRLRWGWRWGSPRLGLPPAPLPLRPSGGAGRPRRPPRGGTPLGGPAQLQLARLGDGLRLYSACFAHVGQGSSCLGSAHAVHAAHAWSGRVRIAPVILGGDGRALTVDPEWADGACPRELAALRPLASDGLAQPGALGRHRWGFLLRRDRAHGFAGLTRWEAFSLSLSLSPWVSPARRVEG